MKAECKIPIQLDQKFQPRKSFFDNKKVSFAAAFLLFVSMSLMIVFTFQSVNGLSKLRQEVDYLKKLLQDYPGKIEACSDLMERFKEFDKPPDDDIVEYDSNYDNYDDNEYYSSYSDVEENRTGKLLTKDAKQATAPPRTKRNILDYGSTRRINIKNTTPTPSSYSYPFYGTIQPKHLFTRRIRVYHERNGGEIQSEENPEAEIGITEDEYGHTRHRQRRLELEEKHVKTGRMRPLPTAHFSGDTSKYVLGQHDNFNGNGHLRHPQKTFVDWSATNWFHTLGMDHHFSLNDGLLTIKEPGLYFIYAQVYYFDEHDMNGFRVYRNENETLLQCTTMTHSVEHVMKANTCFTAGAEYFNENDKISIGDLSDSRYSLFEPGKSFFGLIKLGDVKIK